MGLLTDYPCYILIVFLIGGPSFGECVDPTRITGLIASHPSTYDDNNMFNVPLQTNVNLTLFGHRIENVSQVSFSYEGGKFGESCNSFRMTAPMHFNAFSSTAGLVVFYADSTFTDKILYVCARMKNDSRWRFQGESKFLSFKVVNPALLPLWLQIIFIIILFMLSGLFSGLNLGLMALGQTELKIVEAAGSPSEKRHAKKIRPVRARGNFLLCTLLLGNVMVNSSLTALMDNLTGSGIYAVIFSTVGIVILGEIIPQAVCSRHGLAIGAYTIWITKIFMVITFPMSFSMGFILDKVLGEEVGQVYSREKLAELIREQGETGTMIKDEINIITGALSLTTKTVADVMTKLDDAYMIPYDATLDFDTMNEIVRHGYTRIPVYESDRNCIRGVLNVKDLAFIDVDDKTSVQTVCDFYNRSILIVQDNTKLDKMLQEFRQGKAHMAFVERLVTDGDGDPYREMIGLVTLEDVIEEIIQAEIVDETDVLSDNKMKNRLHVHNQDFSVFNIPDSRKFPRLSPQLKVAALRHLASSVESFKEDYVSIMILQSFLNANIVVNHTYTSRPEDQRHNFIYKEHEAANFAILILQGRALVEVSKEKLIFEAGPFVFFGETVLQNINSNFKDQAPDFKKASEVGMFVPDYSVKAQCNLQYLKITAQHYALARRLSIQYSKPDNQDSVTSLMMNQARAAIGCGRPSISAGAGVSMQEMFQHEWDILVAQDASSHPALRETRKSASGDMDRNANSCVDSADNSQNANSGRHSFDQSQTPQKQPNIIIEEENHEDESGALLGRTGSSQSKESAA